MVVDDMLREAGIDAQGEDNRDVGLEAVVVYLVEQVRKLEGKHKANQFMTDKAVETLDERINKLEANPKGS